MTAATPPHSTMETIARKHPTVWAMEFHDPRTRHGPLLPRLLATFEHIFESMMFLPLNQQELSKG